MRPGVSVWTACSSRSGLFPNSEFALDLLETNVVGEIEVDKNGATGVRGVFAAGDVTDNHDKQIVVAAGEGARAALAAFEYLVKQQAAVAPGAPVARDAAVAPVAPVARDAAVAPSHRSRQTRRRSSLRGALGTERRAACAHAGVRGSVGRGDTIDSWVRSASQSRASWPGASVPGDSGSR